MIIIKLNGFNLGFEFGSSRRLRIDFKEDYKLEDVKNIAKEAFQSDDFKIEYTDEFNSGVVITAKTLEDDKITDFENKLKEKYKTFVDDENEGEEENSQNDIVTVMDVSAVDLYQVVRIYIKPLIITTVITIIFLGVAFSKLGIIKSLVFPVCFILGVNLLFVSTIAILRIPVSSYIISTGLLVYGISLVAPIFYLKSKKAN